MRKPGSERLRVLPKVTCTDRARAGPPRLHDFTAECSKDLIEWSRNPRGNVNPGGIYLDCWQGSWVRNQSPEGPKGTPAERRPFLAEALEEGLGTVCLGQMGYCLGRKEGMGYGRTHELSCLAGFCRTSGPLCLCNTKGTEPSPFP